MSKDPKEQMYRDAIAADRRRYEAQQEHDRGVAERVRQAIEDEARRN